MTTHPRPALRRAVVTDYVRLPGTPLPRQPPGPAPRRLLCTSRRVPLPVVHAALLLAAARRTLRSSHLMPLPPIRTLHYFLPVIEEVLHSPPDPGYVRVPRRQAHAVRQGESRVLALPARPSVRIPRFLTAANTV